MNSGFLSSFGELWISNSDYLFGRNILMNDVYLELAHQHALHMHH